MRAFILTVAASVLLPGCGTGDAPPLPAAGNVATFLGTDSDSDQFARAVSPRTFIFPNDHGPHADYRTEWWYLTGHLEGSDGHQYGVQVTFFRFALAPGDTQRSSNLAATQMWMAHAALTDKATGAFYTAEKFERGAFGLAGADTAPFRVWLADWQLASRADAFFPLALSVATDQFELALTVDAGKPVVLQGEQGLDAKGPEPGNASYYYSYTRLPSTGTVTVDGQAEDVRGALWMDREWSTSVLSDDVEGWNWFALQLDDGRDVMVYRLRRRDGTTSEFSNGLIVAPSGTVEARFTADDFRLVPVLTWQSPESGARYNVGWTLAVPAIDLHLELSPVTPAQELNLTVRYWEGAMAVRGMQGETPITGMGYAEHAGVTIRP